MTDQHQDQHQDQPEVEVEAEDQPEVEVEAEDQPEDQDQHEEDDAEVFPREYVTRLRKESHKYRRQARDAQQRVSELAAALWSANVAATGRLADPSDLPLPEDTEPDDHEALAAAIDDLLARKPHLAARRARGDLGQHERSARSDSVNLANLLRANA